MFKKMVCFLVMLVSVFITSPAISSITEVSVTDNQTVVDAFERYTVTGITTPLPDRETPGAVDVPGFQGVAYVTIGDLNGDGIKEIVATSGGGSDLDLQTANSAVAVYTWDGSDLSTWSESVINETFAFANETIFRDMDEDDDTDIMVLDNFIIPVNNAGIYYLENQGGDITKPANWIKKTIYKGNNTLKGKASYHRAIFFDADNDGDEDFVTSRFSLLRWMFGFRAMWTELFINEGNGTFEGPYDIGDGAGFLFQMYDLDADGDLDIVAPQFLVHGAFLFNVFGSELFHSFRGDSLMWFENPGPGFGLLWPWKRHTINNQYLSDKPLGRTFDVQLEDLQDDGKMDMFVSTHNHQGCVNNKRFWPAGIYLFEVPGDPMNTDAWVPVMIDQGDPDLDPENKTAVAQDLYATDRPGSPYTQGAPGKFIVKDLNDDGLKDLVVAGDGKGALYYYRNDGVSGTTLNLSRGALYIDRACMAAEVKTDDIDGDGIPEIIAPVYDTSIVIKTEDNPATEIDESDIETKSSSIFIFHLKE